MSKLCDKIYELRKKNNMSQDELAIRLDVSRQAISQWEAGKSEPKFGKLRKICEIFSVDIYYFMNDDEDMPLAKSISEDSTEIVACDEAQNNSLTEVTVDIQTSEQTSTDENVLAESNAQEVVEQKHKKITDEKLLKKVKISVAVFVPLVIASVLAIIICAIMNPPKGGIQTVESVAYNFGIESISWIVFIAVMIAAFIVSIFLIKGAVKRKR